MAYALGVDLGTTYTAAAIRRGDRLEIADLGTRTATMPSVVYLREDGAVLTGEAANRRGVTDPGRLSREFKRRMGDTTAILLGGVPYSVDGLMARLLQSVVATVTERQGEPPSSITVAHPANWGPYKKDLLGQAVRRADLDHVTFITEPEAAAVHYATLERLDTGDCVAVYDLGGGTFDAAVLRKTASGFELIGEPEGIERLGGIDFDEAVFRHVLQSLGPVVKDLDQEDPVVQSAVSRLRDECVAAKEALSSDTEVSIPVILPNVHTDVRLTRAEFEAMIRPALADTLVVLQRAVRSAGLRADQLHSVLLVGGSSRIPVIAQLVGAELGRPVALDVHPKHSVALGAAALAGTTATRATVSVPVVTAPVADQGPSSPPSGAPAPAPATAGAAPAANPAGPPSAFAPPARPGTSDQRPASIVLGTSAGVSAAATSSANPSVNPPVNPSGGTASPGGAAVTPTTPTVAMPIVTGAGDRAPGSPGSAAATGSASTWPLDPGLPPVPDMTSRAGKGAGKGGPTGDSGGSDGAGGSGGSRKAAIIGAVALVVIAVVVGAVVMLTRKDDDNTASGSDTTEEAPDATEATEPPDATEAPDATEPMATEAPEVTSEPTQPTTPPTEPTSTTLAPPCEGVTEPCIEITEVKILDGKVQVSWTPYNFPEGSPDVNTGLHAHLYWSNATAEQAGSQADPSVRVPWEISDLAVHTGTEFLVLSQKPAGAKGICATVGDAARGHIAINPKIFHCRPLPSAPG